MLFSLAAKVLLKPTVLQRTDDTLQLRYGLLPKLASHEADVERVADMFRAPDAIQDVRIHMASGIVDARFDPAHNASEVLDYFGDMLDFLVTARSDLKSIAPGRIQECHHAFVDIVRHNLGDGLDLGRAKTPLRAAIRRCSQGLPPTAG